MKNPNPNMLLRIAQGDAYGMAYEYIKAADYPDLLPQLLKFERYVAHPTHTTISAGSYTDDTQMSIAVVETLQVNSGDDRLTTKRFLRSFFDTFKRDPRDGYSRSFQKLLNESKTFEELESNLIANSIANGAAMRSVPIGVLSDISDVKNIAAIQAKATHDTVEGIMSAQAVATMSHFALWTDLPFSQMIEFDKSLACFEKSWLGRVAATKALPSVGINTAHAVHTLLVEENSLMSIMKRLLMWGGDTDSVAAIAWGIASCRYQDEQLPEFLEQDLEINGAYGVSFLKRLGSKLMESQ